MSLVSGFEPGPHSASPTGPWNVSGVSPSGKRSPGWTSGATCWARALVLTMGRLAAPSDSGHPIPANAIARTIVGRNLAAVVTATPRLATNGRNSPQPQPATWQPTGTSSNTEPLQHALAGGPLRRVQCPSDDQRGGRGEELNTRPPARAVVRGG